MEPALGPARPDPGGRGPAGRRLPDRGWRQASGRLAGTNFIRGFRHWGVSIAFVAAGEVQVGVVYDAALDKVYAAIRGGGAFK
ncbi:MAG: inositol monophosphatase family protein, partial [Devosia sp.]|nr:inositol monophosphatase family protein [Devosia sp.]